MKKILFTGGGSAGHVVPNLAVIDEILKSGEADVCYMGTDGIEKGLVATRKIPYYEIRCPKLRRRGGFSALLQNAKIPFAFSRAVKQAEMGIKTFQPDLVFSKGGYVALPVIHAARKLRIPCLTHESDFSAGLANRLAAKKCHLVLTSFPETAKRFKNGKYVGAPLRKSLFEVSRIDARKKYHLEGDEKVLLVLGGGSGSKTINDAVRRHIKELTSFCTVLHICGKGNRVESNLNKYMQEEFIEDMGGAYACADVVLSRAGSGAVFEIMALKKPAVFVPLAKASRGDQLQNAEYFRSKGLCYVLSQEQLERLVPTVKKALADKETFIRLQEHTETNGTENILAEIRRLLHP